MGVGSSVTHGDGGKHGMAVPDVVSPGDVDDARHELLLVQRMLTLVREKIVLKKHLDGSDLQNLESALLEVARYRELVHNVAQKYNTKKAVTQALTKNADSFRGALCTEHSTRMLSFVRNGTNALLRSFSLIRSPNYPSWSSKSPSNIKDSNWLGNDESQCMAQLHESKKGDNSDISGVGKQQCQLRVSEVEKVESDDDGNTVRINQYTIGQVLGMGSFGVVMKGVDSGSGHTYAIKMIDQRRTQRRKRLLRPMGSNNSIASRADEELKEIAIQKQLRHENILPLIEVIADEQHAITYLITHLVDGGALMPDVVKTEALFVPRARHFFIQLVSALHYLHGKNIVHKDIKPSNMLVERKTDHLFLADFGVAQMFREGESAMIHSSDGTMAFSSPEMVNSEGGSFDAKAADRWAAAASLMMMVTGECPFQAQCAEDLLAKIGKAEVDYSVVTAMKNSDLEELLRLMLHPDITARPTLEIVAKHPWCTRQGNTLVELHNSEEEWPIDVTEEDMRHAVSPLKTNSFKRVGSTILSLQRSLQSMRSSSSLLVDNTNEEMDQATQG